jgi:hypothetical protein
VTTMTCRRCRRVKGADQMVPVERAGMLTPSNLCLDCATVDHSGDAYAQQTRRRGLAVATTRIDGDGQTWCELR